ncbi:MAG: L,D-transpeptidase family protein [Alphaproteobacteria bacterium]
MQVKAGPEPCRGRLSLGGASFACALGRSGVTTNKREGDGATPAGCFPLRRVLFRADRIAPPKTALPVAALSGSDGWCDDPAHPDYNRPVRLPHPGSCERLWREDGAYDLIVVVGYNDDPVVPGRGSAIFLHVAKKDRTKEGPAPTEGCVALALSDLLAVLAKADAATELCVEP